MLALQAVSRPTQWLSADLDEWLDQGVAAGRGSLLSQQALTDSGLRQWPQVGIGGNSTTQQKQDGYNAESTLLQGMHPVTTSANSLQKCLVGCGCLFRSLKCFLEFHNNKLCMSVHEKHSSPFHEISKCLLTWCMFRPYSDKVVNCLANIHSLVLEHCDQALFTGDTREEIDMMLVKPHEKKKDQLRTVTEKMKNRPYSKAILLENIK